MPMEIVPYLAVDGPADYSTAAELVAYSAPPDHKIVPKEGTPMNQLTLANDISSVVEMSASMPANVVPFDYIAELEAMHLAAVAAQIGSGNPRHVQSLEKGWAVAKVTMARTFARAQNEIVMILREMPSGKVASPEATAQEVLWNACSADLEKQLLEMAHASKGTAKPSHMLDVLLSEVEHRVEMAKIYAQGKVDVAKIQAALPPARSAGYGLCWGEVTGVREFGAFVRLPSGESGLLHRSELRPLLGGREVQDAVPLLNVGQNVYVRVTGKNEKGQLNFALANES